MGDNPPSLGDSETSSGSLEDISGKIMVAAIIVLFVVIVFVFFLHLYARWFWSRRNNGEARSTRRRSRRFVFAPGQDPAVVLHRGLEPSLLRALPVLIFHPKDFKEEGLECAVCLSELVDGEKARLLPKCNHGFHLECIDMWFQSHSTCPLCRNSVGLDSDKESSTSPESRLSIIEENESQNFPTNVLFWGNQNLVNARSIGLEEEEEEEEELYRSGTSSSMSTFSSTSTSRNISQDGTLVIEIPRMLEGFSTSSPRSSTSRFAEDEMKSPMLSPMLSPMAARLRSLRRLLSREKRVDPWSPSSVDVEPGECRSGQSSKTSSE